MVEKCRKDRDELIERIEICYPEFAGQPPSVWVEDLICSLCGFRVDEYPLPLGQLGVCDIANRMVLTNSEMNRFVDPKVNLKALRNSTLAHELGHIRLHQYELESQFISLYSRWQKDQDSRLLQRENEADLYAAVFLVPGRMFVANPRGAEIYSTWKNQRTVKPGRLRYLIMTAANDFGVTYTLMRRSLEERGWILPYSQTKALAIAPKH